MGTNKLLNYTNTSMFVCRPALILDALMRLQNTREKSVKVTFICRVLGRKNITTQQLSPGMCLCSSNVQHVSFQVPADLQAAPTTQSGMTTTC
jgi:hypothetical protein